MKRSGLNLLFVAFALLAFSCKPAATNVEEARKAIEEADARLTAAFNAKDIVATMTMFAPDAVSMAPNSPAVVGRDQIEALLKQFFQISHDFKVTAKSIDASGDLGYVRGEYTLVIQIPAMPAVTDSGKFLDVWKRQPDGKWLIVASSGSTNLPPPQPAQATKDKKQKQV